MSGFWESFKKLFKKETDKGKNEEARIKKQRKALNHIIESLKKAIKNKDIDSVEDCEEYLKMFFRKTSKNIFPEDGIVTNNIVDKNSDSTRRFLLLIAQALNSGVDLELGNFINAIASQAALVLSSLEIKSITENGFLDIEHLTNLKTVCSEAYEFIKPNLTKTKPKGSTQFSSRIEFGSKTISCLCKVYDSSTISIEKFGHLVSAFCEVITNIIGLLDLAETNSNINKKSEIKKINKNLKDAITELNRLENNLIKEKK